MFNDMILRILLAVGIFSTFSMTLASELSDLRWKNRVVIVFGADSDPVVIKQLALWKSAEPGFRERELVVIRANDSSDPDELARRFRQPLNRFTVVLIGKDGGEKFRNDQPVPPERLFEIIDAMPMRQSEIRAGQK